MLTKSKASACIITLFLSFVLSDLYPNLMNCKLKPCINHCWVCAHLENSWEFSKAIFYLERFVLKHATAYIPNVSEYLSTEIWDMK